MFRGHSIVHVSLKHQNCEEILINIFHLRRHSAFQGNYRRPLKVIASCLPLTLWCEVLPVNERPPEFLKSRSFDKKESLMVRQWYFVDIAHIMNVEYIDVKIGSNNFKVAKIGRLF